MNVTYIHHSCFLVETDSCYYLFDYEKGDLPKMDGTKPIFVLASHWHHDHYNPDVFPVLSDYGMQTIYAVLSKDIRVPANVDVLQVAPKKEYELCMGQKLTTFKSTDVGVAFLIEDNGEVIYHAGDLNEWVWEEESDAYNKQMTINYRRQIDSLCEKMNGRTINSAFVVLDSRQEKYYDRGMCYFLEKIVAEKVYPMHYWEKPEIIEMFIKEHPEYHSRIQKTE